MKINYVIPSIGPNQPKSAGTALVYEYINRLVDRGHKVTLVPLEYFGHPKKSVTFKGEIIFKKEKFSPKKILRRGTAALLRRISPGLLQRLEERQSPAEVKAAFIQRRFETLSQAILTIPDCDVNIATSYQTALAVYLSGKGIPFYFIQHFEEYFAIDSPVPDFVLKDVSITYSLPLIKIANSTWLKHEVEKHYPRENIVAVINYGMRIDIFYPRNVTKDPLKVKVISYGGRHFTWKGFIDAVKAMKIVREKYPVIEWCVFGDSSIPPDNNLAQYTKIGFVPYDKLAECYSACDIMLCPSWYESFAMYPLEAMACGLAVVTTPYGNEDYVRDGENCLLVRPKSPETMAKAVIRLIEDKPLRERLGQAGIQTAQKFTWDRAVDELEKVLLKYVD